MLNLTDPTAVNEALATLAGEVAFLVAALSDPTMTDKARRAEVADSLRELVPQLQGLGLGVLDPYQREGGLGIW